MKKQKVAILFDWYLPGMNAGGPVKSIYSMVNNIDDVDFTVFTSPADLMANKAYNNIAINKEDSYDYGNVYYSENSLGSIKKMCDYILKNQFDTIYFNNILSIKFFLIPYLLLRNKNLKLVVASRGMLGDGALKIKPLKKLIYLVLLKTISVKNIIWHGSTEEELNEIKTVFPSAKHISIVRNISSKNITEVTIPVKKSGDLKLVFLSRISPKKNLLFLLQAIKKMKNAEGVSLSIYGPTEDEEYWNQCLYEIDQTKNGAEIKYCGAVEQNDIATVFQGNHFFILPTLHENFGHVIVEASSYKCPLIISEFTPWTEAIKKNNAGLIIDINSTKNTTDVLINALEMDNSAYQLNVKGVDALNAECFSINDELKYKYLKLFSKN